MPPTRRGPVGDAAPTLLDQLELELIGGFEFREFHQSWPSSDEVGWIGGSTYPIASKCSRQAAIRQISGALLAWLRLKKCVPSTNFGGICLPRSVRPRAQLLKVFGASPNTTDACGVGRLLLLVGALITKSPGWGTKRTKSLLWCVDKCELGYRCPSLMKLRTIRAIAKGGWHHPQCL